MAIKIPVEAQFNQGNVKSQISQVNGLMKTLADSAGKVNNTKIQPITLRAKEDLEEYIRATKRLLNVQTELKKRMQETGQGNKTPLTANWSKLYEDKAERYRKLQEVLGFYGAYVEDLPPPPGKPRRKPRAHVPGHSPGTGGGWRQTGADVVGAGLHAAGPAGSVGARALGTGLSGGLRAGMMGLLGGLLALGIGKAVGAVARQLGPAEDNEIAYDTLKRTLGDVNVAFSVLKDVVKDTGNQYKVTFAESARLSTLYARQGNLRGSDYLTMGGEVGAGIGLSRSFGLAPEAGVSALAGFRGLNVAHNENEVRHFAVLIGETISKSGAFAKADEVMSAISNYTAMQTRQTLTQNVKGYASQLSALTATRLPGMDVQGAANALATADASIKQGGAFGEASQFLLYGIGADLGLNPYQLRQFREGGASATLSSELGKGSMAARWGMTPIEGKQTLLSMVLQRLRARYAPYSKGNDGILAEVTANALGTTMGRAEALQQMQITGELDALQKKLGEAGIDIKDVDTSAMSAMGHVITGSKDDRLKIAKELYERRDGTTGALVLSDKERSWLNAAMEGGDKVRQTDVMLRLLAKHGQQETMGKDIRDSKIALNNIATDLAEKLIPAAQMSRDALLSMIGPDDAGPRATAAKLAKKRVEEKYQAAIDKQKEIYDSNSPGVAWAVPPTGDSIKQLGKASKAWDKWHKLEKEKSEEIKKHTDLIYKDVMRSSPDIEPLLFGAEKQWQPTGSGVKVLPPYKPKEGLSPNYGLKYNDLTGPKLLVKAMLQAESNGQHYDKNGNVKISSKGAVGIAQILPSTGPEAARLAGLPWDEDKFYHSVPYQEALGGAYLTKQWRHFGGPRKALAAYNAGPGALQDALDLSAVEGVPGEWLSYLPKETRDYVRKGMKFYNEYLRQIPQTPQSGGNGNGNMRISADDLNVKVDVTGPGTATAQPHLKVHVNRANPNPARAN